MSYSSTSTYTYTIADIQKVMDQVRADMRMAAESSDTMTQSDVDSLLRDVAIYAKREFLSQILVYLRDMHGNVLRAADYEISADAGSFTATRPGNMRWPRTPSGSLSLLLITNNTYDALTSADRIAFYASLENEVSQQPRPDVAHLTGTTDRTYASNGYGVTKKTYQ